MAEISQSVRVGKVVSVFLVLLLVFCGAYKTPYGVMSISYIILVVSILPIIIFFLNSKLKSRAEDIYDIKRYVLFCFVLFLLFILSCSRYALFSVGDDSFISLQLKQLVIAFISTVLFFFVAKPIVYNSSPKEIFISVFVFLIFLLIFNLVQLTDDSFRQSFINITALDGYWLDFANSSLRGIGLQGLSIWDTSISYSLLFFIGVYTVKNNSKFERLLFIIYTMAIVCLTVLSGRTGLIFLFLFMSLSLILIGKMRYLLVIITLVLSFIITLYLFGNEMVVNIIDFSFELIINTLNGHVESGSTDDLLNNHLFIPMIQNDIFGDNVYIGDGDIYRSSIGRSSDSAFVINFAAFGIVGIFSTLILVKLTSSIVANYFIFYKKTVLKVLVPFICFIFIFLLYVKVPLYVSATLLKTMVFVTIAMNTIKEKIASNE